MLSALLNSIQTTLGSRGFLVSNVFPLTVCAIANGLLAAQAWPSFNDWITALNSTEQTLLGAAGLAGIIVASYALSAVASAILETFEGRHWPVTWFRGPLHGVQLAKLRHLEHRYDACVHGLSEVREGIEGDSRAAVPVVGWITTLDEARRTGQSSGQCSYPATPWERRRWQFDRIWKNPPPADVGIAEMGAVRRRRESGQAIPHAVLKAAVDKFRLVLAANDADGAVTASRAKRALDADYDYLIEAMYFSRNKYQSERIRLFNVREFRFPVRAAAAPQQSAIILAPTTLGNISLTMRSYAHNYYGFDLDVLWTRLQNALRSSDPYFTSLQDTKVQLDFFATCAWLAWVSTIGWLVAELWVLRSLKGFLIAGVMGPLVAFGAYTLACRAYSVFADVMRSGVDLFRFKVLSDLHLPLPLGLEEERIAWRNLASVMGYLNLENPDGTKISISYRHGA